jgi:hypothetical protein
MYCGFDVPAIGFIDQQEYSIAKCVFTENAYLEALQMQCQNRRQLLYSHSVQKPWLNM